MVSEGAEEKDQAAAFPVHPSQQGVCGRHGPEDSYVTHGGLVLSGLVHRQGRCLKIAGVTVRLCMVTPLR